MTRAGAVKALLYIFSIFFKHFKLKLKHFKLLTFIFDLLSVSIVSIVYLSI
jgi:hypothetical protein